MRTKISLFSFTLGLTLFTTILMMPGCEVDYFDPEANPGTGKSLFGDSITVPAGFDWSTMTTENITVKVDDRYNGKYYYQVEIFDANPIISQEAKLLAKGVAKQGQNWITTLDFFSHLETVYVRQISPVGQGVIKVLNTSAENLYVDFSPGTVASLQTSSLQTRATSVSQEDNTMRTRAGDGPSTTYTTPTIDNNSVFELSGTQDVTPNLWSPHTYVIPAGKTFKGSFNFNWTNSFIYIEGTWENTSANIALNGWTIIVQNGGKFISNTPGNILLNPNNNLGGQLIIAAGGEFGNQGTPMIISQNSDQSKIINSGTLGASGFSDIRYLYNYGSINLNGKMNTYNSSSIVNEGNLIIDNGAGDNNALSLQGNFRNEGTVRISGTMNTPSNNFILTNTGFFEVNNLGFSSGTGAQGTINNEGQFIVTNNASFELTFNVASGALLEVKTLTMRNSAINIADNGMLNVTGQLTISKSGSSKIISGPNAGNALAKIQVVSVANNANFELQGELEVECSNYQVLPDIGTSDKGNTTGEDVRFVMVGESTVTIPPSDYNKGGNNNTPSTPPTSPVFPIIYEGSTVTYLFEDGWPYLGDFDMNDLVMDLTPTYSTDANNKVTQLRLDIVLRAIGATKRLGVGLQLDGVNPSVITNVTRSNSAGANGSIFSVGTNGLEQGQTNAVIPLFDVVHEALGRSSSVMTNTIKGSPNSVSSLSVPFTIIFNTPIDKASVGLEKFNVFLINGGYQAKRHEVHMSGFQATDKADHSKFGFADDNSNVRPYTSKGNMIWGLAIPGSAKYPAEWTSIKDAYPEFESWATSSGTTNLEWYKYPNEDAIYE
ncbi:MAG: LruC domain-containing protein [Proteiniphilum sp.]|nr:LruC domain-containing protein [Proteiniphilum sp.]MDD4417061.1 LruC domain-containing protein [Proteiniphilum sp.]